MRKLTPFLLGLLVFAGAAFGLNAMQKSNQTKTASEAELAERYFIEQMVIHHEASIGIASTANDQAQTAEIKAIATILTAAQTREISGMKTWYKQWFGTDVPPSTADPHAGHAAEPTGDDAPKTYDRAFILKMIPHHEKGIQLIKDVLPKTKRQDLKNLARSIETMLASQVEQMKAYKNDGFPASKSQCDSMGSC